MSWSRLEDNNKITVISLSSKRYVDQGKEKMKNALFYLTVCSQAMQDVIAGERFEKFYLYSGHDHTGTFSYLEVLV